MLVVCEFADGGLAAVSAELLSRARPLADELGGSVAALIAGDGLDRAIEDAATFGADLELVADDPRLNTGLAADCTDLEIADWTRRGHTYKRFLHQVRPAMGSSVLATCVCPETRPQMASVLPGVFSSAPAPRNAHVESVAVDLLPDDLVVTVIDREVQHSDTKLSDAPIVVAGGAGCSADNWHLVEELAAPLGGRVAASRAAVEAGRSERALQVGQIGTTVKPDLYVACGVSGAFQHVIGMRPAKTVVAINRDPDATIFQFAHYGVVGDVADTLPRQIVALRSP